MPRQKLIFNPHPKNSVVDLPIPHAGREVRIVGEGVDDWDFKVVPKLSTNTSTQSFMCNKDELVRV